MCGATGSGKSYFSMAVCERFFPGFTVDNVVFSVKEFLNKFTELHENNKRGSIILFDEGEEWNARRAMEIKNVEFGNILSMIRFTNISAIFTLPDIRQIDVTLTRLMHNYIYTMDIDRQTCPVWMRHKTGVNFFEIIKEKIPRGNTRDLKVKYPRMDVIVRNKRTNKLYEKHLKIPELWYDAPSKELLKEYEIIKNRHFNAAMDSAKQRILAREQKDKKKMALDGVSLVDSKGATPAIASNDFITQMQGKSDEIINKVIAGDTA